MTIVLLILNVLIAAHSAKELSNYNKGGRGWNGFMLAASIHAIFACIVKLS